MLIKHHTEEDSSKNAKCNGSTDHTLYKGLVLLEPDDPVPQMSDTKGLGPHDGRGAGWECIHWVGVDPIHRWGMDPLSGPDGPGGAG